MLTITPFCFQPTLPLSRSYRTSHSEDVRSSQASSMEVDLSVQWMETRLESGDGTLSLIQGTRGIHTGRWTLLMTRPLTLCTSGTASIAAVIVCPIFGLTC